MKVLPEPEKSVKWNFLNSLDTVLCGTLFLTKAEVDVWATPEEEYVLMHLLESLLSVSRFGRRI